MRQKLIRLMSLSQAHDCNFNFKEGEMPCVKEIPKHSVGAGVELRDRRVLSP